MKTTPINLSNSFISFEPSGSLRITPTYREKREGKPMQPPVDLRPIILSPAEVMQLVAFIAANQSK